MVFTPLFRIFTIKQGEYYPSERGCERAYPVWVAGFVNDSLVSSKSHYSIKKKKYFSEEIIWFTDSLNGCCNLFGYAVKIISQTCSWTKLEYNTFKNSEHWNIYGTVCLTNINAVSENVSLLNYKLRKESLIKFLVLGKSTFFLILFKLWDIDGKIWLRFYHLQNVLFINSSFRLFGLCSSK